MRDTFYEDASITFKNRDYKNIDDEMLWEFRNNDKLFSGMLQSISEKHENNIKRLNSSRNKSFIKHFLLWLNNKIHKNR